MFILVLQVSYNFCPNRLIYIKGKFSEKYSKIFSETIRCVKLKLGILANDITLYKSYVFYCQCPTAFVAMASLSSHRLIMGKVEIEIFCCLKRYLIFFYRNIS